MGVLCHILPLPYVVQGSLSLSNLGEPQSQALFPPTHILAIQTRFAILTGFALGGKKGSEGAPKALHQSGASAARGAWAPLEPQGAWKGKHGEPSQLDPAGIHRGHGTGCVPRV